jgi:hypothetical protein
MFLHPVPCESSANGEQSVDVESVIVAMAQCKSVHAQLREKVSERSQDATESVRQMTDSKRWVMGEFVEHASCGGVQLDVAAGAQLLFEHGLQHARASAKVVQQMKNDQTLFYVLIEN